MVPSGVGCSEDVRGGSVSVSVVLDQRWCERGGGVCEDGGMGEVGYGVLVMNIFVRSASQKDVLPQPQN